MGKIMLPLPFEFFIICKWLPSFTFIWHGMLYFLIFSRSLLSSSSSRPKPVGIVHQYISHISEARIRKLP
ncbi:unnamed protein product [Prunus brigantina]